MMIESGVRYHECFITNRRGIRLFACKWLPANNKIKALVFLCHGYGVECSVFMKGTAMRLAQSGFAVFGLDYAGHGKSEGLRCYIDKFSDIVDDCASYFKTIREQTEYKDKARFLLGESMGGAVALLIHRKQPNDWNGAVLVAPMVKIAEELKPSSITISILSKLSTIFPTWKIVPIRDIIETGFKDPLKRQEMRSNPYVYQEKPRLRSGLELLNASLDLEGRLTEVTMPFMVLHGEADVVTDIDISKSLHDAASSFDKTLKTYPGMWHSLLFGETEDNIELVMSDIVLWLNKRSPSAERSGSSSPTLFSQSHLSLISQHSKKDQMYSL
ncbi:hypothetical protein KP509_27G025900 [Ceratopteris richardii]|uniref:Serine aminopeptidase S33 domain-containing protein n=2 Tax=Ceratopteris richardii TaxID=49495 RepID=A0A8T2RER0_CERRI|nr:hypothetical protein KP509_1Z101200 [Ceratopteris richardii]KAH7294946.1 hypothetical protein KP509_27G025900 [Ceratopteris richardii]